MSPATSSSPSARLRKLRKVYQDLKSQLVEKHARLSAQIDDMTSHHGSVKIASQQLLAGMSLAGAVALNKPVNTQVMEQIQAMEVDQKQSDPLLETVTLEEQQAILEKMRGYVKQPVGHLPKQDELYLEQQLSDMLGFEVVAELDEHRLNHSIGIMGGEQHLKRFPNDTLEQHDSVREAGIAPNRGAFGWFTESGQLTPKAIERERYYFAVQTMYLPDWNSNHKELKPWYKFRKMIMINPADEIAVVGVVGDAGPALWVKKQFGGSPEVIREGKVWSPKAKGRVLLYFVDDPNDEIPLGPIDLSKPLQVTGTILNQTKVE